MVEEERVKKTVSYLGMDSSEKGGLGSSNKSLSSSKPADAITQVQFN